VDKPAEITTAIDQLRDGRREVLSVVFDYFRPRLRQMVRLRMEGPLRARIDPSDVLQDVYLDATRRVGNFVQDPKVSVFVWLRGLTGDRLKKLQRHHLGAQCRALGRELRLPEESSMLLARQLFDSSTSPSRMLLKAELRERVRSALACLDDDDREMILMRHFEGMNNEEVAETLGLTRPGASMRHGRALARLKETLLAETSLGDSPR
jgi:RNA polymerase sigma-70 factor (ECF subfamily)